VFGSDVALFRQRKEAYETMATETRSKKGFIRKSDIERASEIEALSQEQHL
jgi:hypothetical protein